MRPCWDDVIARVSGLRAHLLTPAALRRLSRHPSRTALARGLEQAGYRLEAGGGVSAETLELAIRRVAATRLRTLARWCGHRVAMLGIVFEDEDRRSLRQLIRGAVEGAAPDQRAAGLVPTPALPERALEELSRCDTVPSVGALLAVWHHPFAPAVLAAGTPRRPPLLPIEVGLSRCFFARALSAARKESVLLRYVRDGIDLENIWTAAGLTGASDLGVGACFIPGGARIPAGLAREAAALPDWDAAVRSLAEALGHTRISVVLRQAADRPAELEARLLTARYRDLTHDGRLAPLSPAPVLAYALAVRLEVLALQRLIWGLALGAPESVRAEEAA